MVEVRWLFHIETIHLDAVSTFLGNTRRGNDSRTIILLHCSRRWATLPE